MSSLISVAYGMPLIAIPAIVSGSTPDFSDSSRMMSVIAAAMKPIRLPKTPTDRQPIFTSFGGSPAIPRAIYKMSRGAARCVGMLKRNGTAWRTVRTRDVLALGAILLVGAIAVSLISIQGGGGMMSGMGGMMGGMALAGVLFFVAVAFLVLAVLARPAAAPPPMPGPPPQSVDSALPPSAPAGAPLAGEAAGVALPGGD